MPLTTEPQMAAGAASISKTLSIENTKIIDNTSPKSGGGIGIGSSYSNLNNFLLAITVSGTTFYGNTSRNLYGIANQTYIDLHGTNINPGEGKTYSSGLEYAYNDYDISYYDSTTIDPLPSVTVTYDALGGSPMFLIKIKARVRLNTVPSLFNAQQPE